MTPICLQSAEKSGTLFHLQWMLCIIRILALIHSKVCITELNFANSFRSSNPTRSLKFKRVFNRTLYTRKTRGFLNLRVFFFTQPYLPHIYQLRNRSTIPSKFVTIKRNQTRKTKRKTKT